MRRILLLAAAILIIGLNGCNSSDGKVTKTVLGMQCVQRLEYSQAIEHFQSAIVTGESPEEAYRGQGMAYMGLMQYTEAIEMFERALEQAHGNVGSTEYDISYYLAVAEYKNDNIDGALLVYDSIIQMNPTDSMAYHLKGSMQLEKGLDEEAIKNFDMAISLDGKNYDLYIKTYEVLEQYGKKEVGTAYLQKALDADSNISDYQKGKLYYYSGDYNEARNSLEKAKDENNTELLIFLGKTYEALGDWNYAASLYSNYLTKNQEDVLVYNQLGLCKINMLDYEGALQAFEQGIALGDTTLMQSLKFNEIVAYEYLADYKKATVLMEEYLRTYPDDEKARREYEFLKSR